MNLKCFQLSKYFSKKNVLQIYFICFILLNVFDFLNFLSGDIDFFKKILSWILIGYVFYKASFSKIFVGVTDRFFDWMFILGFSLMGIVKSIFHYLKISDINDFSVFYFFLRLFPENSEPFLTNAFVAGVFVVLISSYFLIKKYKPSYDSLVGSFKLKGYFKFVGGNYFILFFTSLFFGLVVFNFIMEWFALAVDSIILILGLIYYIFMYVHKHTLIKTDNLLSIISNTGSSFYQSMISTFSNKNTFLIGVSFILTLHLLVDIGVYLIPFTTGLHNSLYGSLVGSSMSIFNFLDLGSSQFVADLGFVKNEKIVSLVVLITN